MPRREGRAAGRPCGGPVGPWQRKQLSERIGRTSRLNSIRSGTVGAERTFVPHSGSRAVDPEGERRGEQGDPPGSEGVLERHGGPCVVGSVDSFLDGAGGQARSSQVYSDQGGNASHLGLYCHGKPSRSGRERAGKRERASSDRDRVHAGELEPCGLCKINERPRSIGICSFSDRGPGWAHRKVVAGKW